MGTLLDPTVGRRVLLEAECIVGRSPRCSLRLESTLSSSVHACVRWTPDGWEVRDLGSRNGTFVNGAMIGTGHAKRLKAGDSVAFGSKDPVWVLVESGHPQPMAVCEDGTGLVLEAEMIAIPSSDRPVVTIYRTADGAWLLESPEEGTRAIHDGAGFVVGQRAWRFVCPDEVTRTGLASGQDIRAAALAFAVSRDEEHVSLRVRSDGRDIDLGARTHHYLLLTLARRRLSDAESSLPETSRGWMHVEELTKLLRVDPEHLNVEIFRIRKQLAAHFANSGQIVERRQGTGQLRLGVERVEVAEV
jgi:hypothetical protein